MKVLQFDVGGLKMLCHSRVIDTGEAEERRAGERIGDREQLFPDKVIAAVVTMRVQV